MRNKILELTFNVPQSGAPLPFEVFSSEYGKIWYADSGFLQCGSDVGKDYVDEDLARILGLEPTLDTQPVVK